MRRRPCFPNPSRPEAAASTSGVWPRPAAGPTWSSPSAKRRPKRSPSTRGSGLSGSGWCQRASPRSRWTRLRGPFSPATAWPAGRSSSGSAASNRGRGSEPSWRPWPACAAGGGSDAGGAKGPAGAGRLPGWLNRRSVAPRRAATLGSALRQLGQVAEEELWSLYAGATVFAFPSRHEGFGLPVIEAMSQGTAVVASDIPAVREVAGGPPVWSRPATSRAGPRP